MFRYLSVMDDLNAVGSSLDQSEWTTAIAFVGHSFPRICGSSVEAAILEWKDMEQKAKLTSGHVTFNIFFDLATKAEKFGLADMILKEMNSRRLSLSRFAHVGLIRNTANAMMAKESDEHILISWKRTRSWTLWIRIVSSPRSSEQAKLQQPSTCLRK